MPSKEQLEQVLAGEGRVMQVYNQSQDEMGAPSLGLGGLCMGLSYSFLRGQLKAARDVVPNGCYFDFKQASAHARFAQATAMVASKLAPADDKLAPLAKKDNFTVTDCFQYKYPLEFAQGNLRQIAKNIALEVELQMLGEVGWLYAILSIYKPSKASHAIALKAQQPDGPFILYDPNLGLIWFENELRFDEGFANLFARYYPSYHGCKMRKLTQNP